MTSPAGPEDADPTEPQRTASEGDDELAASEPDRAARARRRLARLRDRDRLDRDDREAREDREHEERMTQRLFAQWSAMRDLREERRHEPVPMATGPSNLRRAEVPWGVDLAAAWGWRLLVIGALGYAVFWLVGYFAVITIPIAIALLLAALLSPFVRLLERVMPRSLATLLVVIGTIAVIAALLTFAGQQVASGASDLADSTVQGLGEIRTWLKDGPLKASDSQINSYIQQAQDAIRSRSEEGEVVGQVTEVGTAVGHVFAGFFIVLFATYFFLADGNRIWAWLVRISPRAAREQVDSSGRVAWISLTQFVRATVIVALVDAVGIAVGAAVLQVPFVLAIGVLVFIGAFIPLVGATVAGAVAVLVALVDQGPITALIMLGVIVVVQQLEAHILQPFLMGRWVSVHPLGVILALAMGILVGGIAGALVAVPLAASINAVVQHLAANTDPGDDPVDNLAEDYETYGATTSLPEGYGDQEGT